MERDGDIDTACVSGRVVEVKKIHRVISELKRLKVAAAGLQETHWFGQNIYAVNGFTVICSGRPTPGEEDNRRRGEGVALVLNRDTTSAWRAGSCVWNAVSSRIVSVRLKYCAADGPDVWLTLVTFMLQRLLRRGHARNYFMTIYNALCTMYPRLTIV